ncbi:MAG TPA: ribosome maturation factor RimP [Mycobacteriales bacterium]|nr:ribosome maturation factor RimP [Mycobacteriales bacterium]
MSTAAAAKVRAAIEPALTAAGFHLEDVAVRPAGGRRLVQVLVDRDRGVSLDDVADASRIASGVLDAADVVAGAYVLEVSSPGVDRPLTEPRHWRRNVGRLVTVTPQEGPSWTGRVVSADDVGPVLDAAGTRRAVRYDDVRRALVQVEFNRSGGDDPVDGEDRDDA